MLVLRRRLNEEIIIAGDITVKVIEVGQSFVRLGITAPRNVTIDRSEVAYRKAQNHAEGNTTEAS